MLKPLLVLPILTTPVSALTPQPFLRWSACPIANEPELQCADLPVALSPNSDRKVARLPATGARKGSVLVNFGGPQGYRNRYPCGPEKRRRALVAEADREPIPAPKADARFDGTQFRHDGPGHNLFGAVADPCAIDHVSRYVTDRRLPPRGATCP